MEDTAESLLFLLEWIIFSRDQEYGKAYFYFYPEVPPFTWKMLKLIILKGKLLDAFLHRYFRGQRFADVRVLPILSCKKHLRKTLETLQHLTKADCLYRYQVTERSFAIDQVLRYGPKWEYVALLDVNEIIVPRNFYTIPQLIEFVEDNYGDFTSFGMQQFLFPHWDSSNWVLHRIFR